VWGERVVGRAREKEKKKRKYEWAKETTMFLFARMSPSFSGRAFLLFVLKKKKTGARLPVTRHG
jgi:hypothetical protein